MEPERLAYLERLFGPYVPAQIDPTGGDGYIRGSWDAVERALGNGLITDEEYEFLVENLWKSRSNSRSIPNSRSKYSSK